MNQLKRRKSLRSLLLAGALVLLLAAGVLYSGSVFGINGSSGNSESFEVQRAKLVSFVLREELSRHHYSHRPLDDALSADAFALFLKQLDGQKRFLLQKDVARLRQYATRIDDEINRGVIELPALAEEIMAQRVAQVRGMVKELLAAPVDFRKNEELETDPDKLEFCADEAQLHERWRLILKYQMLVRLLNLQEEQKEAKAPGKAKGEAELLAEARAKITRNYEQFFSRMTEEKPVDRYDRYFNSVTRAFDPHTDYLPPTQKEDFDISMRGSLEGIGATLKEDEGYIKVVQIIPGSAAWRQGKLQAEDTILKVAEGAAEPVDVTDMRLRDAVSLIRGKKGTEVRLTVRKADGATAVIPIIRDVVQIEETFVKSTLLPATGGRSFGYVRIPSFYRDFQGDSGRNVTDDTRREVERLTAKGIDGLIIDLRNNGGGALTDAVAVAGLFIEQGPVVQVRDSRGKSQVLEDEDAGISYRGPLVVLVNQFSASASEILAAALQDYRRAVIVGSAHTHGKGTVQAMLDLDRALTLRNMDQFKPLGALKVTIQKFYRVSGGSTQFRGVIPDVVLPDRLDYLKSGEQYIDHALPWDTVTPTPFTPWSTPVPDKGWLTQRSRQRVEHDPEWRELVREAAQVKARSEKTRQSLRLEDVRREREEERKLAAKWDKDFPHAAGEDEEGAAPRKVGLTAEERERLLAEEAAKDPVAKEGLAILADLLSGKGGPFAAAAESAGRPH